MSLRAAAVIAACSLFLAACGGRPNHAPSADAGQAQSVYTTATVTLDGSRSTDPDGNPLSFRWEMVSVPAGSAAALSDAAAVRPTFVADVAGDYVFSLSVFDGELASTAHNVSITAAVENLAPVADAGTAQSVATGSPVTLDGTASSDANGDALTYAWTLSVPAGSAATLSDPTAASPVFTPDLPGSYVASLVVSDASASSAAATVTVTAAVANAAPVAHAGPAQSVTRGDVVTLDGSASSDANGDTLTYAWSLTTRPALSTAALSSSSALAPTFTADKIGTYVAQLIVSDGQVSSTAATVTITAAGVTTTTELIQNGSFEQDLTGWSQGTFAQTNAAGTCSYNATVAPGTETLTSTAGFPATDGTKIVLGSVASSSGLQGALFNCTLYQDVQIPVGVTSLTLKYDIAVKAGNDGCQDTGVFVAVYGTGSVPAGGTATLGGAPRMVCTSAPATGTTLVTVTHTLTPGALAGTTVRVGFVNAAEGMAGEVVGIDKVSLVAVATN